MTPFLLALILAFIAAEVLNSSTWLARIVVRKSAFLRYGKTERGKERAEDWEAMIEQCPFETLRLCTAVGLAASGVYFASVRRVRAVHSRLMAWADKARRKVREARAFFNLPFYQFLIVAAIIVTVALIIAKRRQVNEAEILMALFLVFLAYRGWQRGDEPA